MLQSRTHIEQQNNHKIPRSYQHTSYADRPYNCLLFRIQNLEFDIGHFLNAKNKNVIAIQ